MQVLKDGTTLADNKVGENGFLVVMVQKVRHASWLCELISASTTIFDMSSLTFQSFCRSLPVRLHQQQEHPLPQLPHQLPQQPQQLLPLPRQLRSNLTHDVRHIIFKKTHMLRLFFEACHWQFQSPSSLHAWLLVFPRYLASLHIKVILAEALQLDCNLAEA